MTLPIIAAIGAAIFFGILAIYISMRDERKLESRKETKGKDFINMMIHELRAPLTAIKDSAKLLTAEDLDLNKKERIELAEIIHKQSLVLLDQIGAILDAAKLDAGKFIIIKSPGDIKGLIEERVKIFHPQASKKNISISSNLSNLPTVSFDPMRIAQVMNNLISNSIKFTPEGGKITITGVADSSYVRIQVSDNGIGIPHQEQKEIFTKFSQGVSMPTQLIKDGTGLGLYVVKGIIEAHKGTVSLESTPGKGTTISFTLPVG